MRRICVLLLLLILIFSALTIGISFPDTEPSDGVDDSRADPGSAPNYHNVIDLAETAPLVIEGKRGHSTGGDNLGAAFASGDINGDGLDDLLVSAKFASINTSNSPPQGPGEIYVYYNKMRSDFPDEIDLLATPPDLTIFGENDTDEMGTTIAIGNVNGDAYNDIIIGVPEFDLIGIPLPPYWSRDGLGGVYIIYGDTKANLGTQLDMTDMADRDVIIRGKLDGEHIGTSLGVGDLDNDGYDDIIIGAPGMNRTIGATDARTGGLYIVWGRPVFPAGIDFNNTWYDYPTRYDVRFMGTDNLDEAGFSLDVGDINDDGYADILVGAPSADGYQNGFSNSGEAYVICGNDRSMFETYTTIEKYANLTLTNLDVDDHFGWSVDIGEIDGDGHPDMMFGVPNADGSEDTFSNTGEVFVVFGSDSTGDGLAKKGFYNQKKVHNVSLRSDLTIYGRNAEDKFGEAICIGDMNADGMGEMIAGAKGGDGIDGGKLDSGEVYLFYGASKADLPSRIDLNNESADLTIYGQVNLDALGDAFAVGDIDNDGVGDLFLGASNAKGPNNARKGCGEVYGLFGSPFRVRNFELVNGFDVETQTDGAGRTCFAGLKDYRFDCDIYSSFGVSDLDHVDVVFDPGLLNITYRWDRASDTFTKQNDDLNRTVLNKTGTVVEVEGENVLIKFRIMPDWSYYKESPQDVLVRVWNGSGVLTEGLFENIFNVENDLTLVGDLYVESSVYGDISVNGSWCPSAGVVNWTGLRVIYQDSTDIYPPDEDFYVSIKNLTQHWTDDSSSGEDFFITTPAPYGSSSPLGVFYDIDILGLQGASSDVSDRWMYIRVDRTGPPSPDYVVVRGDSFTDTSVGHDDDNEVYALWNDVVDMTHHSSVQEGKGVKAYYYSLEDNGGTRNGTLVRIPGGLTGHYYNTLNFVNLSYVQVDPALDFDWGQWSPDLNQKLEPDDFSIRWDGWLYVNETGTHTFYIDANDGAEIWIDGSILYNEWNPSGPMQVNMYLETGFHEIRIEYGDHAGDAFFQLNWSYGSVDRQVIPEWNLYHTTTQARIVLPGPGEHNIYVWAEDLLGNIGGSHKGTITVDNVGPVFSNPVHQIEHYYTTTDINVGASVADNSAGVSTSSVQYRTATDGKGSYSNWTNVPIGNIGPSGSEPNAFNISFNETFEEGTDNYIQFRAKDLLGNGYEVSEEYNIWVDTTPVEVSIQYPATGGTYYTYDMYLNGSIYDKAGSGVELSSIEYRTRNPLSQQETNWTFIGFDNLTVTANGRLAVFNISLDIKDAGLYTIELRARDIAGNPVTVASASAVKVNELIPHIPPSALISGPMDGSNFTVGEPILFDGLNTTDEDTPFEDLYFYWTSSWNGGLSQQPSFIYTKDLHLGEHKITLFVDDGDSNVSVFVRINILDDSTGPGPVNPPPDKENDTDSDGLPDSWEMEHFGGLDKTDGSKDSDGDGYSDLLEYQYDSDPTKDTSIPPPEVLPDMKKPKDEGVHWAVWLIVVLGIIVLLAIIASVIVIGRKQKKKDQISGDNVMMYREKTRSDMLQDERIDEEREQAQKEDEILRKSRSEKEAEAADLYGEDYDEEIDDEDYDEDFDDEDYDEEIDDEDYDEDIDEEDYDEDIDEEIDEDDFEDEDIGDDIEEDEELEEDDDIDDEDLDEDDDDIDDEDLDEDDDDFEKDEFE